MLELLLYPTYALAVVTPAVAVLCYWFPNILLRLYMRYLVHSAGMTVKYVTGEHYTFCYVERGEKSKEKPTLLFIHGFTGSKDDWIGVYKRLPKDLHIICLDLPGHGRTTIPSADDVLSFDTFIEGIHQFVVLVGLDKEPFHIIGQSLGGCFVGLYAAKYSKYLNRVTLICPAMKAPEKTFFEIETDSLMNRGLDNVQPKDCCLLPQTTEELQNMMKLVTHHPRTVPKLFLKGALYIRAPYTEFYWRLFKALCFEESGLILEKNAPNITVPVQAMWGRHDQIVHISAIDILKKVVPNLKRVDVVENCGHSINYDRPGSLAKLLLQFRGELPSKKDE